MRLPNAERALISAPKLTGYLLSAAHPRGRGKALFFRRFGFDLGAAHLLEQSLLQHVLENEVVRTFVTAHGTKYEIEGPLRAPDGRTPMVRSVWIIEASGEAPHFVTAFPGSRRRG